jgi:hypothetical protein
MVYWERWRGGEEARRREGEAFLLDLGVLLLVP